MFTVEIKNHNYIKKIIYPGGIFMDETDKNLIVKEKKEEARPLFEKAMMAAYLAKNWLAMELLSRAFNDKNYAVWVLNSSPFIGITGNWITKITKEKKLSFEETSLLRDDINEYADEYAATSDSDNNTEE